MIRVGELVLNPAHIMAYQQDSAASLIIHMSSVMYASNSSSVVTFRADSPDELNALIEEIHTAVDNGANYPR